MPGGAVAGGEAGALDEVRLARVATLDVVLGGPDPAPDLAPRALARLVDRLPALRALTLCLRGIPGPGTTSLALGCCAACERPGLALVAAITLDAGADAFAALGGGHATPPTSLIPILEASRRLRLEGAMVRWLVPVVPALVYRLEALFSLARDEGVEPALIPAGDRASALLDGDDLLFASDFLTHRLLDEDAHLHAPERARAYRALAEALSTADVLPPARPRSVTVVYAAEVGEESRWVVGGEYRAGAGGSATGSSPSFRERFDRTRAGRRLRHAVAAAGVLRDGGRAVAQWMRAGLAGRAPARPPDAGRPLARVLLIGAYGGEHIGDAAILGGVLVRLHQGYGTSEAVVMSQRPAHTRHLIAMLDAPIPVDVAEYEHAAIREHVSGADAVVFAGGPLIDLPKQLVRHLYTVSLARRHRKPFIAEGIGPGPFPRWPSEWTARRIVSMAERISVRTSTDAESRLMNGRAPEVGRDPAFDYLATRSHDLTRLRARDRDWIERLLQEAEGRLVIGVNLRPIRSLFTVGVPAAQRPAHTRAIEARFEERLAEGLQLFHRASPVPPCFVFFPMNAVQFGMSDLRTAYRLARALGRAVDLRVWEADASLDGVVALLRRVDAVIAMRFHAAIFALSQERRVIGIDYRVGARDKVAALLDDVGQAENCSRIDAMTSDWLLERLIALTAPPRCRPAPDPRR